MYKKVPPGYNILYVRVIGHKSTKIPKADVFVSKNNDI